MKNLIVLVKMQFKEKLNQNNNGDQIFAWNPAQIQLYEDFVKRAKNLRIDGKRKWYKANEGNFLEAFTRFLENTNGNMAPFSSKGKLSNLAYQQIREAMEQTMSNPGAFYTGGDIGNLQLKGNAATISQASTIENMLNTTNILLSNIISMAYNVQASPPGGIAQSINNSVEQTIKETIEELVKPFFNI